MRGTRRVTQNPEQRKPPTTSKARRLCLGRQSTARARSVARARSKHTVVTVSRHRRKVRRAHKDALYFRTGATAKTRRCIDMNINTGNNPPAKRNVFLRSPCSSGGNGIEKTGGGFTARTTFFTGPGSGRGGAETCRSVDRACLRETACERGQLVTAYKRISVSAYALTSTTVQLSRHTWLLRYG